MKLWPGSFNNELQKMNNRVDEENGKALGIVKIWDQKVHQLSSDVL